MLTFTERHVNSVWDGWSVPYTVIRKPIGTPGCTGEGWTPAGAHLVQIRDEQGNVLTHERLAQFASEHADIFQS